MGRKTFAMGDPDSYADNYEFQVPTKESAGDKDVTIVGGANIVTQAIQTGLVDEIHMDITPILFGKGLRPFEQIEEESIQLEKMDVMEISVRTHLKFRVLK
jgi:dihydrofolate reductase